MLSTPKTNYLNNRDILKEIHLSKNTFCSFKDPNKDHQYDIILPHVSKINRLSIASARRTRAERILKETGQEVNEKKIPNTELVFRVMTWEHIPLAPKKPKKVQQKKRKFEDILEFEDSDPVDVEIDESLVTAKNSTHIRVNFPPFIHYRLDENREPYIVGKSHWKGDLEYGSFSKDHGEVTRKLATMYIKLCERYATRSNWRGYCVDSTTQALTNVGWVDINTINETQSILSYNNGNLVWSEIWSIYRGDFNGDMHYLLHEYLDSVITPNHKVVTKRGLIPIENLRRDDRIILSGNPVTNTTEVYSDNLVKLFGLTVFTKYFDSMSNSITIPSYRTTCTKVENSLEHLNINYSTTSNNKIVTYKLHDRIVFPKFDMSFVNNLSTSQRIMFTNLLLSRSKNKNQIICTSEHEAEAIQALCVLIGKVSKILSTEKNKIKIHISNRRQILASNVIDKKNRAIVTNKISYSGKVWCPETEHGCFIAKRNGIVYLTGNTYNEEMRGQALLQLSQIGLQFDESRSSNPFAYYTAAITNSFTRVLNIEKKMQNMRDDILELNGLNPSWSRQNSEKDKRPPE